MKILAIGDVVGERAVEALEQKLKHIKESNSIDFVIVNGENASNGDGLSKDLFNKILNSGADVITMGNHTWGNKEIYDFIDDSRIVRPANMPSDMPGAGYRIIEKNKNKILVINLIGKKFMTNVENFDNPFLVAKDILDNIEDGVKIRIVDFHAVWTGEKTVMGHFLDGRVSAIYGTHTHVQTADETILPRETGYISDLGMTGAECSKLGFDVESGIDRYVYNKEIPEELSNNNIMINGCVFDIDENNGRTKQIRRINIK